MVTVGTQTQAGAQASPARLGTRAKAMVRRALPLSLRKRLAVWVAGRAWLSQRHWWANELVRDMAEGDVSEYHRFLWANHLAYAQTYEIDQRYGAERVHPTRHLLFAELRRFLVEQGLAPERDIESVLEVGCSMGYLLHFMEQSIFPAARVLDGIDIDAYAIEQGRRHLDQLKSRVRLVAGDMVDVPKLVETEYDLVLCAGVLMYVPDDQALEVMKAMLSHARRYVVLAGLAHPDRDNETLKNAPRRESDQSFIHNLDSLVERAGGRVVWRRWEGARKVDGNTIYFLFAEPGPPPARRAASA